jgi:hypothetical protein
MSQQIMQKAWKLPDEKYPLALARRPFRWRLQSAMRSFGSAPAVDAEDLAVLTAA